jgi:hypothetical protein
LALAPAPEGTTEQEAEVVFWNDLAIARGSNPDKPGTSLIQRDVTILATVHDALASKHIAQLPTEKKVCQRTVVPY